MRTPLPSSGRPRASSTFGPPRAPAQPWSTRPLSSSSGFLALREPPVPPLRASGQCVSCLLYTSDAADDM
eukprot:3659676-Alexandrium_andersonii.AAC.1